LQDWDFCGGKRGNKRDDIRWCTKQGNSSNISQGLGREVIQVADSNDIVPVASSHSVVGVKTQVVAPSSQAESSDIDSVVRVSNNEDRFSNNGSFAEAPSPTKQNEQVSVENEHELEYIQEVPNESMLSQGSFLTAGFMSNDYGASSDNDGRGDFDEFDEFDMYKDDNLELMRKSVGEKLLESDDMMSEALTKALMDDEELQKLADSLYFGDHKGSMEIEASVLCDTYDWLKRNDRSGYDSRRTCMQEIINKMVAGVRYNIIGPEDASRTIQGCATLLEFQLGEDLPETTIIITGMPKTIDIASLRSVFKEYGEIQDAAIASRSRGFGLVRYRWTKSAQRVMNKHRNDEIVVQDVAVTVRLLRVNNKDDEA